MPIDGNGIIDMSCDECETTMASVWPLAPSDHRLVSGIVINVTVVRALTSDNIYIMTAM